MVYFQDDQFVTETLLNALYLDSLENSHPINLKVDNPNQINELFDAITYDKVIYYKVFVIIPMKM
jgi:aminopeptidase N